MGTSLQIGGVAVPWSDVDRLVGAAPSLAREIKAGAPAAQVVAAVGPEILAIIETVANLLFPGAGTGIDVIATLISMSRPMTAEEERAWMDRLANNADS